MLSSNVSNIPKADMHVHLEGTISPAMVISLAEKNNVKIPKDLIKEDKFYWEGDGTVASSLNEFLKAYDDATSVMKTAQDYTDITYDYLKQSAEENCIYVEFFISADHGRMVGLSYPEMLNAIEAGYNKAKLEFGIEARLVSTSIRHYGIESTIKVAEITRDNPHHLVTSFGIAGDENAYSFRDFKRAFDISGLPNRKVHAGEAAGIKSIIEARDELNTRRFGHMVRATESENLMQELKDINAVPEVCISSNMALKVFDDYASHPLRKFFDFGLKVTLGSDDPSFFNSSIGKEYEIAKEHFGFSDNELKKITRNAIEEAFVDENTREQLLERIES